MDMYIYLTIGFIYEFTVILGHILAEVKFSIRYNWYELFLGAIVDIIAWPIIIILSIICTIKNLKSR
jgi:hypothetical protein